MSDIFLDRTVAAHVIRDTLSDNAQLASRERG